MWCQTCETGMRTGMTSEEHLKPSCPDCSTPTGFRSEPCEDCELRFAMSQPGSRQGCSTLEPLPIQGPHQTQPSRGLRGRDESSLPGLVEPLSGRAIGGVTSRAIPR